MNRPIEFKVWDKRQESFRELFHITTNGDTVWHNGELGGDNFILIQYTGKKDKYGIKIYEGDIVRRHYFPGGTSPNGKGRWYKDHLIVMDTTKGAGYKIISEGRYYKGLSENMKENPFRKEYHNYISNSDTYYNMWIYESRYCEVISNRFENPELITQKEIL